MATLRLHNHERVVELPHAECCQQSLPDVRKRTALARDELREVARCDPTAPSKFTLAHVERLSRSQVASAFRINSGTSLHAAREQDGRVTSRKVVSQGTILINC